MKITAAVNEPLDRLKRDDAAADEDDSRLTERGDVFGPPVPVVVLTVSRANRDPDRAQSEHRRDHIARGLDTRRDQRQTPRRETRTELERDQDDGGGQRGNRRALRTRDRLGPGFRLPLDLSIARLLEVKEIAG